MTITILNIQDNKINQARMFFDLNDQLYQWAKNEDQDVDIVLPAFAQYIPKCNFKIKLFLNISHNWNNQQKTVYSTLSKISKITENSYIVSNAYDPNITDSKILFNDFLFNRTKAYYSQYPFDADTELWYNHGQLSFIAPRLQCADNKKKIFVAPNKTYENTNRTITFRPQLVSLLKQFLNAGYLGNIDANKDLFLYPHIEFPYINSITELEQQTRPPRPLGYDWWGYCPPHNEYYKNTFISIYGETIEHGSSLVVTEKTYDPLIKGHFILPFSNCGFVAYLKTLGFKFPNFIDYSYDQVTDDNSRWQLYQQEVIRLLNLNLDVWKQNWNDNLNILKYNQLIFHNKPYDRIDFLKFL